MSYFILGGMRSSKTGVYLAFGAHCNLDKPHFKCSINT